MQARALLYNKKQPSFCVLTAVFVGNLFDFLLEFLSGFGGDNGLRESIVTGVLFVFEHFFYSVLKVS